MQVTDDLIRNVVQEVLAGMRNGQAPAKSNGQPATTPAQLVPALGREGVLNAFYGNPRQVFLSLGAKF